MSTRQRCSIAVEAVPSCDQGNRKIPAQRDFLPESVVMPGNQGVDDFNVQRIGEVRIQASKGTVIIKPLNVCNEMGYKTRHKWNVQLSAYRSVVVGNIHSNPELLEK